MADHTQSASPPGRASGNNNASPRGAVGGGRGGRGGRGGNGTPRVPKCKRCGEEGHTAQFCTSDTPLARHADVKLPPCPPHRVPYIDTHCHIDYMCEAARVPDWGTFLKLHAMPPTCAGVITTMCDTTALLSSLSQLEDLLAHHSNVYFTFGLHPHNARYWNDRVENRISELVTHPRCVGWGEIGLDITSEKKGGSDETEQVTCFVRQLSLAAMLCPDKPIQIHFRGPSATVLLDLLQSANLSPNAKLHLHSWGVADVPGTLALAKAFPRAFFGFTAVAEAKRLANVVAAIPLNRFVLETDGPYLLPNALKPPPGSQTLPPTNHPGYLPFVAAAIARLKNVSVDRVLEHAKRNVEALYGLRVFAPVKSSPPPTASSSWDVQKLDADQTDSSIQSCDADDSAAHAHIAADAAAAAGAAASDDGGPGGTA